MSSGGAADNNGEGDAPGEATLLVSEFPPPPFYYADASKLTPPEIPKEALERGTRRAAAAASRARAEAERLRLADESSNTDAILGGVPKEAEEEEGDVVAVFGEIVEVRNTHNPGNYIFRVGILFVILLHAVLLQLDCRILCW